MTIGGHSHDTFGDVKHGAMDTYGTVQMLLNACKPPITVDFEGGM